MTQYNRAQYVHFPFPNPRKPKIKRDKNKVTILLLYFVKQK